MAKGKHVGRDWSKDTKAAFEFVFNTHFWGNRTNSGKGPNGGWDFNKRTGKARVKAKPQTKPQAQAA